MNARLRSRQRRKGTDRTPSGPLSRRGASSASPTFLIVFGLPFLAAGLAVAWFLGVRPILKVVDAKAWDEAPARVLSSSVKTHRGSDSTTYSIDITFEYEWQGRTLTSDRYDFSSGSSSGYNAKADVVRRYPAGHAFTAFVNPANPEEAVVNRELHMIYVGLLGFGAVFVIAGCAVISAGLVARKKRGRAEARGAFTAKSPSGDTCMPPPQELDFRGDVILKPDTGPWIKALGILFFALFWNGIISVFLWNAWQSVQRGRPDYFLIVFMIPFALIGIGTVLGFFYTVMAALNPRVRLRIEPGHPRPGDTCTVHWEFQGDTKRLHDLSILLEGEERATYRQGTSTSTDHRVFYRAPIAAIDDGRRIGADAVRVVFPADAIHSFDAPNNKIVWRLVVRGGIRWWPDLKVAHPFVLLPGGKGRT